MGFFTYKVSFEITYFCQFGESVMVLGNVPELGKWDVKNGLKLQYIEVKSKLFIFIPAYSSSPN